MDPRDPRAPGNAPPDPPLVAPRRNDEELTERFGPPAPKPRWDKPVKPFDRERFLLWCVAWILGVQFGLFVVAGLACTYGYTVKLNKITSAQDAPVACPAIVESIKTAANDGLAILLALLGGGTIAVAEYQRRRPPEDDPRNPRR